MPQRYVHSAPIHLNGNMFCAVDCETTGLDAQKNSIIEICILPLNSDYSVNKSIMPFDVMMQPIEGKEIDLEALRVNKIDLAHVMLNCLDAYKVADLLVEWFDNLQLPEGKNIVPIAQNWPFDMSFITSWIGDKTYRLLFNRYYRDTYVLSGMLNDRADMLNKEIPFPKQGLSFIAGRFGIENPSPHRALGDAWTTAAVYKQMLTKVF